MFAFITLPGEKSTSGGLEKESGISIKLKPRHSKAKGKTSYLPPVGSISEENEVVEQAGRDDAGKTLGHGNMD